MAKKEVNTGSARCDPHFGHLMRFRARSAIDMVRVYFFLQLPQRKSYVAMRTLLKGWSCG